MHHLPRKGCAVSDVHRGRPFSAGRIAARHQGNQRIALRERRLQMGQLRGRKRDIAAIGGPSRIREELARGIARRSVIAVARQERGTREVHLKVRYLELLLERIAFTLCLDEANRRRQ